jgi:hypothetical protein
MSATPFIGIVLVDANGAVKVEYRAGASSAIHGFPGVQFRAEQ